MLRMNGRFWDRELTGTHIPFCFVVCYTLSDQNSADMLLVAFVDDGWALLEIEVAMSKNTPRLP